MRSDIDVYTRCKNIMRCVVKQLTVPARMGGGETENYIDNTSLSICKVIEELEQRTIKNSVYFFKVRPTDSIFTNFSEQRTLKTVN